MKHLREIVGKGSLETIRKHHDDAAKSSKMRSDDQRYHSIQATRASRDISLRDKKSQQRHVDLTNPTQWKRNLRYSIEDGKKAKLFKAAIDAKAKAALEKKSRRKK